MLEDPGSGQSAGLRVATSHSEVRVSRLAFKVICDVFRRKALCWHSISCPSRVNDSLCLVSPSQMLSDHFFWHRLLNSSPEVRTQFKLVRDAGIKAASYLWDRRGGLP